MFDKIIFKIIFCLSFFFLEFSMANISIIASVDDKIITNHDLKKESDYLKILNPNLTQLNNDQILKLAKSSLINEIIKKKEISKFIDTTSDNTFLDQALRDLYSKLNFEYHSLHQYFSAFLEEEFGSAKPCYQKVCLIQCNRKPHLHHIVWMYSAGVVAYSSIA